MLASCSLTVAGITGLSKDAATLATVSATKTV